MHWRNWEKQNHQEDHESASFFSSSWVLESFFFWFWENVFFTSYVACYVIYHVVKHSNSSSQMFFEKGVLKYFAIYAGKQLCLSLFLIKLQEWRSAFSLKITPTQVFSCDYCKTLEKSFFIERLFNILFRNFKRW